MYFIIIPLFLGVAIGTTVKLEKIGIHLTNVLTIFGLIFLLFSMGLGIGGNEEIFRNLKQIGFKAFILALGSVIGSCLFLYIIDIRFFKSNNREV